MPKYHDNELYYVYNHGAHRFPVFASPEHYRLCLRLAREYGDRYVVSLLAFCLLPNQYRFILQQTTGGSISRFLQTLFNAYVLSVNRQTLHKGTLFERIAQRRVLESEADARQTIAGIHLAPIAMGFVQSPADWEFSDYATWIGEHPLPSPSHNLCNKIFGSGAGYSKYLARNFQQVLVIPYHD